MPDTKPSKFSTLSKRAMQFMHLREDNTTHMLVGQSEVGLPDDIIFEIFLRLPVKSLVRLSSVCKSWRNLITRDELFIRTHYKQAMIRNDNGHGDVLMFSHTTMVGYARRNDDEHKVVKSRKSTTISPESNPLVYLGTDFIVAGNCDGLVCFYKLGSGSVYLWNPSLHQCRTLETKDEYFRISCLDFVAFGYDPKNNDYKVVRLLFGKAYGADVFSLKRNSWRKSKTNTRLYNHCKSTNFYNLSLSFNRCLHWISTDRIREPEKRDQDSSILVFDIVDERLDLFKIPSSVSTSSTTHYFASLGVLKGCLSFIATVDCIEWDVWSMKTYGASESWVKAAIVVTETLSCPIGFSAADGKILLLTEEKSIFSYDVESSTCSRVVDLIKEGTSELKELDHYFVADYVESLISLPRPRSRIFKLCTYFLRLFLFFLGNCFIVFIFVLVTKKLL